MEYSKQGLDLTKAFESCRLTAYRDIKGVLTIGYGHTNGVKLGDTCTPEQADEWLAGDLLTAEGAVNRLVKCALRQCQFDALVSLCFNIGQGNFAESTVLKRLNVGTPDYSGAATAFLMWVRTNGDVNPGLVKRREAEEQLFLTPDSGTISA